MKISKRILRELIKIRKELQAIRSSMESIRKELQAIRSSMESCLRISIDRRAIAQAVRKSICDISLRDDDTSQDLKQQ